MSNIDWPDHLARTPRGDRSHSSQYSVTLEKAVSDLETEIERLDPNEWRVEIGNQHTKSNGMPLHNANPDDPGFVLRWRDDGKAHAVGCDHYSDLRDNVREVGKWIMETRMRDDRHVVTGGSNFAAAQLPEGDATAADPPAHAVLGVDSDASTAEIEQAFREKARDAHPDGGGSEEAFKQLQRAKNDLLSDGGKVVTDGGREPSEEIPKADRQENIKTHEGVEGAVIGRITNFEAGSATRSIEVAVDDLRRAVETDLADSYPSAYLWCDGQTLCVTDHRTPIDGEDAVGMADLGDTDVTIKRTAVVQPSDEAVCALFDRELIAEAIDEIDADRQCVTVHVTPDFALVLEGERAYAVAHMQDTTIESRKGGQLVTDGGSISDPSARIYCTNCHEFRPRNDGDCSVCGERLYHVEGADA